jgi:hypothetical protein
MLLLLSGATLLWFFGAIYSILSSASKRDKTPQGKKRAAVTLLGFAISFIVIGLSWLLAFWFFRRHQY